MTVPGRAPIRRGTARWRSGYAAACKAVYTGSNPVLASNLPPQLHLADQVSPSPATCRQRRCLRQRWYLAAGRGPWNLPGEPGKNMNRGAAEFERGCLGPVGKLRRPGLGALGRALGAIAPSGEINMNECLQCLDGQLDYYDAERYPPLIQRRKRKEVRATLGGAGGLVPEAMPAE